MATSRQRMFRMHAEAPLSICEVGTYAALEARRGAPTGGGAPSLGVLRGIQLRVLLSVVLGVLLGACENRAKSRDSSEGQPVGERVSAQSTDHSVPASSQTQSPRHRARALAGKLGKQHFLIGMGNDLSDDHDQDGAYTLGPPLDLHYAYLVGLRGRSGWPDWNPDGTFVTLLADSARRHGVIPMYTLYALAADGEGNSAVLSDPSYMSAYLDGARLLFRRLGEFDHPAIVHLEPDFWGFMQKKDPDPAAIPARVTDHAPECADLDDDLAGLGRCLLRLARRYAPKTLVGFHASTWAHHDPQRIADYLTDLGARQADLLVVETLDRDAGCYEAGIDPSCRRTGSRWYWNDDDYREHLDWARMISDGMRLPLLWWQMPFGVPSDTPGGKPGRYRDNRVQYLFQHVGDFVAAGGVGAVFGVGAANQTYVTTDGGQFRRAVERYRAQPFLLGDP